MNYCDRTNLVVLPEKQPLSLKDVLKADSGESLGYELEEVINFDLENQAKKEFAESDAKHALDNIESIYELLSDALAAVRKGEAPEKFGTFLTGEISRILSAQLFILCLQYDGNGISDEAAQAGIDPNNLIFVMEKDTDESIQRIELISSFAKFLKTAASLAASLNSPAARDFMKAYIAFDHYEKFVYSCATTASANQTAALIDKAIDDLKVDIELKKLPPFRKGEV